MIKYLIFHFETYLSSDGHGVMFYTLVFYSFEKHLVRIVIILHSMAEHFNILYFCHVLYMCRSVAVLCIKYRIR